MVTSNLRIDTSNETPLPRIAAAFLVNFDHRKGYTVTWHKSVDGVQVEGVVEFKSLPSGLHNVAEDLVYFVHEGYAGLSAFLNKPDEQSARNARMLAVGVLVPLDQGRVGRVWRHAQRLKDLASSQIEDVENTSRLEQFWEQNRLRPNDPNPQTPIESSENLSNSNGYQKSRSMSSGTHYISANHSLTPHHPATTLLDSLNLFGPLIFTVFRAALLHQRILIVIDTPVEFTCNLVYNLSILASISRPSLIGTQFQDRPYARLRPLYTIGVSDIPTLVQDSKVADDRDISEKGWIACTTDDVLSTKPELYDLLILMPPSESRHSPTRVFPRLVKSSPALTKTFPKGGLKATQRDFHRYIHLQRGLQQFSVSRVTNPTLTSEDEEDSASISSNSSTYSAHKPVVESPSWSRVAYTSLVWWASAGDRRGGLAEMEEMESEQDSALLLNDSDDEQTREVALVAYFHRMTNLIFRTITEAVARTDGLDLSDDEYHDEEETTDEGSPVDQASIDQEDYPAEQESETQGLLQDEEQNSAVDITREDVATMGLDTWSASDKQFVEDLTRLWWGREARVRATTVECCGLRIL